MQNFSELPISSWLKERLASARFSTPTPIQAAAIPQALEGKDLLATAQTGTGKTLAFLIPVIEKLLCQDSKGIAALVLVPTRELAMQVADQFNALRGRLSPAALVVGGLPERHQLSSIRNGARVVVATPGRLEDFLDRKHVHFGSLQILVLDEADRMLDMGFLPAIRRIVAALPQERQTMCFSATMEGAMGRLVKDYTRDGDRSQSQRIAALEAFQRGRCRVLVATDLASRGIHVQDIVHVINYDLPEVAENFIHRVGRTGRAGGRGVASTLFAKDQRTDLFELERTLGIRMERMRLGGDPHETGDQMRAGVDRMPSSPKPRLVRLPGEVLQAQMES